MDNVFFDSKKESSFVFMLFGSTGDLSKRKIFPALYRLFEYNKLSHQTPIVAVGRRHLTHEEFIRELNLEKSVEAINHSLFDRFIRLIYYVQDDLTDSPSEVFKGAISEIQKKHNCKENFLVYLATPPKLFISIVKKIHSMSLIGSEGWLRVAFEKPFGHDFNSAQELNLSLNQYIDEKSLYRIDHYLGKALVQDLFVFRFSNSIFDQIWNNNFISRVQITVSEEITIGSRAAYYDQSGAIRDMLQNHLLQILALITMDKPSSLDSTEINDLKVKVIKSILPPQRDDFTIGQYEGYKQEQGVSDQSKTETFVSTKIKLDHPNWKGVPFFLKTGKALNKSYAEVNLILKDTSCQLFYNQPACEINPNYITIRIQPDTGIALTFNAKKPGNTMDLVPVTMDFCHHCLFAFNTPGAYEALLSAIINGDKTIFPTWEFIQYSWAYIDQLKELAQNSPLTIYPKQSEGPK